MAIQLERPLVPWAFGQTVSSWQFLQFHPIARFQHDSASRSERSSPYHKASGPRVREATGDTQSTCPTHGQRFEHGTVSVAGRYSGRGYGGLDLVFVPFEARQTSEMKTQASPRDWVEIDCGCHSVQPSARAITETLSIVLNVLGIAAIQEGGQVSLWTGAACQAAKPLSSRSAHGSQRRSVCLNSLIINILLAMHKIANGRFSCPS